MNAPSHSSGSLSYGLDDFVSALFRNKKKVIGIPLVIFTIAALSIWFIPRQYRSEAKLFMQVGRESVKLDPTATTGDTISMQTNDRASEIITVVDMLKSRGTIEKVVDKLGPDVVLGRGLKNERTNVVVEALQAGIGQVVQLLRSIDPVSDRERAVITIERNLEVEAEHDSLLIYARYDAKSPALAKLVTQTLVDIYRDEHLRLHRTSGSKAFFADQFETLKTRLDGAVDKMRQAKNRMSMVSIDSRRGTLESRMASTELSLYGNLQQLAATRARVANIRKQLAATPERMIAEETTVPNTGADLLREQVFELQVLMLDQQAKYSDDHPLLQATREQLKQAEAMFDEQAGDRHETTNNSNPNHHALTLSLAMEESSLAGIVAQSNKLEEQRTAVLADLRQLNDYELEIDQLSRTVQLARSNYFRYAENLEKARIDEELDKERISNAILAQEATFAEKPVSPSKVIIIAFSLLLSISSVVSMVLIGEKIGDRIYKEEQLEESLRIPVFGVLPEQKQYMKTLA